MSTNVGSIHYDLTLDTSRFNSSVNNTQLKLSEIGSKITSLGKTMSIGLSLPIALAGAKFVSLASDLQTTQQRMEALTGSAEDAKRIMGELYNYTLGKPITFPDTSKAAQVLMGYGVQSNKVVDAMKTLSAFAIVNGANMDMLALAYGQVNAKGRLMGQEIIQLTNNFVPVSKVIAKHFNVSVQRAMELMEDGKVTAEEFNQAMSEFIPQSKIAAMSNTFKNRMISLQGSLRSLGLTLLGIKIDEKLGMVVEEGGLFDSMSKMLPIVAKAVKAVSDAFKSLSPEGQQVVIVIGLLMIVLGPLLVIIGTLITSITTITGVIGAMSLATLGAAAPFIALAAAIYLILDAAIDTNKVLDKTNEAIAKNSDTEDEASQRIKKAYDDRKISREQYLRYMEESASDDAKFTEQQTTGMTRIWEGFLIGAKTTWKNGLRAINDSSIVQEIVRWKETIVNFFNNSWNWLYFGGVNLIAGFYAGILTRWNELYNWIRGIPGWIKEALGNLWGLLWDVGWHTLNSLWEGMKNVWNGIAGWLGGLKDKIKRLKGPLDKDKIMLINEGRAVMQGFDKGLQIAYRDVEKTLSGITSNIGTNINIGGNISSNNKPLTSSTTITFSGPINLGDKSAVDAFFAKLSRNQELAQKGLATL